MKGMIFGRHILIFLLLIFAGCKEQVKQKTNSAIKKDVSPAQYKKPGSGFNDTLIIANVSAVFYNPDSVQLNNIKTVLKKDEYETEVHNCFYLIKNARRVIKQYWRHVQIIEVSKIRYLVFVKDDKSKIIIDLNTKNDMCGIFLFDKKKDPELIDMMNINTALGFYFRN